MGFHDLPPRKDPKGGSPKTPSGGIPVREYQEFVPPPAETIIQHSNGNGVWKMLTSFLSGLVIGLTTAYVTALQQKGVTDEQLKAYDATYSLYARDRQLLFDRNNEQDRLIGGSSAEIKKNGETIQQLQFKMEASGEDRKSIHNKLDQVADMLQSEKAKK